MHKELLRRSGETAELLANGSYAQAIRAGNLVFLQGQTGLTLEGEIVFPNDPAGQTRQALDNQLLDREAAHNEPGAARLLCPEIDAYGVVDDAA